MNARGESRAPGFILLMLSLGMFSTLILNVPSAAAASSVSVAVNSQNSDGQAITGFRTVLYSSGGAILAEGYTPSSFTVTVGQTYGIRAESYGSCAFTKWSDGVASDPRSYTATSSGAAFTAVYECSAPATSSVNVDSVNQDGAKISGYRTVLYSSTGGIVAEGFTPGSFTVTVGDTYGVRAESYGDCAFTAWSDGVTANPRSYTATASASTFTAAYDCIVANSSVTIDSVDQNGATITGYRTILYASNGSVAAEGFTPDSFTTTPGQTYSVKVESYGGCSVSGWSDGVTSEPRTFVATSAPMTFTAVFQCAAPPTILYDEQLGMTYTQNSTKLIENVTAVAQTDSDGYGPAYLLNGLDSAGYWYQVGIAYDWPGTPGGFTMLYEVWSPGDVSVFPANGAGYTFFSTPVTSNDTIQLSLTLNSNGIVNMVAEDLNTASEASFGYSAGGGITFVGLNATSNNDGYFSGLMTEEYHSSQYSGGETPVTFWSSTGRSSSWMWADELQVASSGATGLWGVTTGLVRYTAQNPVSTLSYSGAEEYSTAYKFVTGTI